MTKALSFEIMTHVTLFCMTTLQPSGQTPFLSVVNVVSKVKVTRDCLYHFRKSVQDEDIISKFFWQWLKHH